MAFGTRHRCPVLVAVLVLSARAAAQAPQPMTLVDLINLPQVGDPRLSPDGHEVVFVRSDANWRLNKRISHIWRVRVDGSGLAQMTNGAEGESSPRWSPDGASVAFLAKRQVAAGDSAARGTGGELEHITQLFVIRTDGGEAREITAHATDVSEIMWAPDGATIYFRAADPKSEEQKTREKAKDDVFMFDENFEQQHLWRVSVATGAEHRITGGDYSVTEYALSHDGSRIVYHRAPTPLLGDMEHNEVWTMEVDGSHPVQLTHNAVPEQLARISPDNSRVLFIADANARFEPYYNRKIFVMPATGGEAHVLMPDLPYEIDEAEWSTDGRSIYFLANMGIHSELFRVSADGGAPEPLTRGDHAIEDWSWSDAARGSVFTLHEMSSPGDVWVMPDGGAAPRKVTSIYDDLPRRFQLPRQERVQWKGADGVTVEGLLDYPIGYEQGHRYPLVVQTHGGPAASDKFGLGGVQSYLPVLAAKGYAVLRPNYRGSTGYGDSFLRDMVGHYFKNAHLDVLAGVDYLISTGIADSTRLVKMGWSGGGHMTNKIITFTQRFKAASSGAGAADWVSMYAQSDVRSYRTPWFGGTPWQKNAPISVYWDNSPLKDVWRVTTPTIFLVGQDDRRVPEPQSVEMYRALKSNGVPTHLYVAPREPHGWGELRHVLFKMNAELSWFEQYAMHRNYVWERAPSGSPSTGATQQSAAGN